MTPASRRPRFEPLRSATPPSGAQNAHHSIEQVVQFSMSPPVQFRMSFDSRNTDRVDRIGSLPLSGEGTRSNRRGLFRDAKVPIDEQQKHHMQ